MFNFCTCKLDNIMALKLLGCLMQRTMPARRRQCLLVACFIPGLQEECTLHSFELTKTKNCIYSLFPSEISYIYNVKASSFETLLTFLGPSFFMISVPTFYCTSIFVSVTHKPNPKSKKITTTTTTKNPPAQ